MHSTPILDLEQPPPQPPSLWPYYVLGGIVGVLLAELSTLSGHLFQTQIRWPAVNDFLIIPAFIVSIAIHELGHLLAGLSVGLGVDGLSVGPFAYFRSGGRWTYRFELKACFCGCYKPRIGAADHGIGKYAWMVAGGPLSSLILVAATGFACSRFGSGTWAWMGTLFWATLLLLPLSLFPYSGGGTKTDGARLWQLIRHPEQAKAWVGMLDILSQEAQGVRPRDWNSDHFRLMLRCNKVSSGYAHCQLMAHYRRLDEGLADEALEHLENALSESRRMGKFWMSVIFIEAASASAVIRKRPEQARIWRERSCAIQKPKSLEGLDAEIAMAEGRYEDALKHWEAATAYLDRLGLDSGLIRFAREELLTKEAICRAALSGTTS